MTNVYEWLDDVSIRKMVLPKIKIVFEKNHNDLKIVANVLQCIERTLDKLDKPQVQLCFCQLQMTFEQKIKWNKREKNKKEATHTHSLHARKCEEWRNGTNIYANFLSPTQIIDEVLPLLWEVRLSDPDIILRVVRK